MDQRNVLKDLLDLITSDLPFTDLMLQQDSPVQAKMPGGWEPVPGLEPFTRDDLEEVAKMIEPDWDDRLENKHSINRPFELSEFRLRINIYLTNAGQKVVVAIRRLPKNTPTIEATGLPSNVRLLVDQPRGLILISGATGSGKSTTMAALVQSINETRNAHVLTIEDPIEYVFEPRKAVFSQREVGVDTPSYFEGVREAMRQRPDVMVIGEIRDRDTAETALLASESGHLVIGTVHANSAIGSIQKILAFFNSNEREAKVQTLSGNLVGAISQVLIPKKDRSGYALGAEILFNHTQLYSKTIGEPERLANQFENRAVNKDTSSISMVESIRELVVKGEISLADGHRSVTRSQGDQLRDSIKS